MTISLKALAQAGIGQLLGSGEDVVFTSVSTDTRTLNPGQVFVAIEGETFNGHEYIQKALDCGAAALVVKAGALAQWPPVPCLVVDDTKRALGLIAKAWLQQYPIKKAAITGSCGKTTVKELTGGILAEQFNVLMTQGNLNNEIGLPLTLFRLEPEHEVAVLELGANHMGEIAWTAGLVTPDVAVVNNVGEAHLEGFGSVARIAKAKAEIYDALPAHGVAVINLDDRFSADWLAQTQSHPQLTFSIFNTKGADISLEQARYVPREGSFMLVKTPVGLLELKTQLLGEHNWANVLAAVAIAVALEVRPEAIIRGVAKVKAYHGRLKRVSAINSDWLLIDDTYNANPTSTRIAIDLLATCPRPRVLVLGNMAELGDESEALHHQIGVYAREHAVDQVLVIGENAAAVASGFGGGVVCPDIETILKSLEPYADGACSVLVKGSRSAGMERIVAALQA